MVYKSLNKINLLTIAYKNLNRHKVKSILTATAITIGIALYIWMDGFLYGMDIDSKRNLVNYETGSAKIYSKTYFENKDELPLYESFNNYTALIEKLNIEGFNASPHAVFSGSLMSEKLDLPFLFIGVDPKLENEVFKYNDFLENGSKFVDKGKFEVMLGVKGAKDLNVKIGDKVRLSTIIDIRDDVGKIKHIYQLIDLKVCGIINSPNPKINGNVAYLPLDILQDEQGILLNGRITELCIRKKGAAAYGLPQSNEEPEIIKEKLGSILPDNLVVVSWKEDAKDFLAVSATKSVTSKTLIVILFLLAIIGITNSMLMSIFERTKEIGMLRALGMSDFQMIKLIIYESGLLGFIGTLIGVCIGIIATYFMVKYGIDYTAYLEKANVKDLGYRVVGIFKAGWDPPAIIGCIIFGPIISALAAVSPALKAAKMSIIDCLRFE